MKFLDNILLNDADFASLLRDTQNKRLPLSVTGLSLIHKAAVIKAVNSISGQKVAVITKDEAEALEMMGDAKSLGINAVYFPQRDYCIGDISGYSKEYEHKRTDTLSKLLDGDFDMLVCSVDSAISFTTPPEILKKARFNIKVGDTFKINELTERLLESGYTRSEICEGIGQFSVRGGIFDVFPVTNESPCRIEFWGDEIDNISYFDSESQRRTENIEQIEITPACEVLY
ncbi:MAG: hypothetical protein IKY45_05630, partial [Clostridia bacterium]|nr:hypothetical protein [Clostridia bacterium]